MRKLGKKILFITILLVLAASIFGLAACSGKGETADPGEGKTPVKDPDDRRTELEQSQYFAKINAGLVGGQKEMGSLGEYHVSSTAELYTRIENLTVEFEGVYKENRRNGRYFIKVFDNNAHIDRLNLYYDSNNLYITIRDEHYYISDFGSLLIFDAFSMLLDVVDIGDIVYGDFMQDTFKENSIYLSGLSKNDFTYTLVGEKGESITVSYDLWILLGMLNDQMGGLTESIGTTFDAVSDFYLGFELSKLIRMTFGSLYLEEIRFNMQDAILRNTTLKINGLMQDSSKYFVNADYSYDAETTEIAKAKNIPTQYNYLKVTPEKASFEGKTVIPSLRESDYDFSLDYDVDPGNNENNNVAVRVFDQLATHDQLKAETKYDRIKELFGAYYKDEITYANFEGMYDYIGQVIALNTLRLPKIYFTDVNLSGLMNIAFNYGFRILRVISDPEFREQSLSNRRLNERILNAVESDVEKKEIRITVTEELIKEIRGDDTPLSVVIGEYVGLDADTVTRLVGNDFFELMRIVIRYNFGTGVLGIDFYEGTTLLVTNDMKRIDYLGVKYPFDLNDLNYAEFLEPDVVTLTLDMTFNPYGTANVDVSSFFGSLVGDQTGKNTPQQMGVGEVIVARGQVSEYYTLDYKGERQPVTSMNLAFYLVRQGTGEETILSTIVTNPSDTDELLVKYYSVLGTSPASEKAYKIDRRVVTDQLNILAGGESVLAEKSAVTMLLELYNAAEKNAKAYTQDGYFSIDMMVTDEKDPVFQLIGIPSTNARIKAKASFEPLDLSAVRADDYKEPYIHSVEAVSASGIYATGSKWKEKMTVTIGNDTFDMYATYDEESTAIETGRTEYYPTAHVFGKEFGYVLHIVNLSGTYRIRTIDLEYNVGGANFPEGVLIVDPAFYAGTPKQVDVTFDGGEKGKLDCIIEDFPDSRVTADGYNLALFAGISDGVKKNKLIIGKDSIATIERDIYVAVANRRVIAVTDENGQSKVFVQNGEQIPLVAEFTADPYTFAMKKRLVSSAGGEYDYLREEIENGQITINFDNLYAVETVYDDTTGQDVKVERRFNREGYNWNYLKDLDLDWEFEEEAFSWRGETRYAVAYYGDKDNADNVVKVAIKVEVAAKTVESVTIDNYAAGTYLIDYLVESSYGIPMTTTNDHTVKVVFTDGTERIVSLTRSALITDEEYCVNYIYGQLAWEGASSVPGKLELDGSYGLFGSGTSASNVTTAQFGGDLLDSTQRVSLNIIAPTRAISGRDYYAMSLVTHIDVSTEGEVAMGSPEQTNVVGTARYTKPATATATTAAIESYGINPYNVGATLPDTIWLYVNMTMAEGAQARKEWVEYPVYWTTTDRNGNELNIIKMNDDGRYVLAHPVTRETYLKVYGQVGAPGRRIWVEMSILNLASDIRSYELFLPSGASYDVSRAVSVDPHLTYASGLPSRFSAVLGSGQTVEGETDWYYGDYPIVCKVDFLTAENRKYYRRDNTYKQDEDLYYYIFPKDGGEFRLKMVVSAGEVSNDLYINVSVSTRTLNAEEGSNFVDVFGLTESGRMATDGTTYEGVARSGYLNINGYSAESAVLLNRIDALIANGGVGVAGYTYALVDQNTLYAKSTKWDVATLTRIKNSLEKRSTVKEYTLTGIIDSGNVNETSVRVRVTLSSTYATLTEVGLPRSATMTDKKIYKIKNDENGDRRISVTAEGASGVMTLTDYYRTEEYKRYFGTEDGYTDRDFSGFIFFELENTFMLSKNTDGTYTSPYDYFVYLTEGLELKFSSEQTLSANASGSLSTGTRSASYFNSSVLGFVESTIVRDDTGAAKSYSFLIMEKLSEGSAIDRYLIIVSAEKANVTNVQRNDEIDALGDTLNELYPENFVLPKVVEVDFEREDGTGSYTAKYAVPGWTPTTASYFGNTDEIVAIEAKYIDVINGATYGFKYLLPDMENVMNNDEKTFSYVVKFRRKNANATNYNASARSSLYDIKNGKIVVSNSYTFLTENTEETDSAKRFVFNKDAVPTIVEMIAVGGYYERGENDSYDVVWNFTENAAFSEDIFRTGTGEEGTLIATYEFDSYYVSSGNEKLKRSQRLELYLVLAPMEFTGITSVSDDEPLMVVAGEGATGENEKLNTIVIDPYDDANGYNGTFVFPTRVRVIFNDGETYDFTNVTYYLADDNGTPMLPRTSVQYGDKGHKLNYPYTQDPFSLRLAMSVRGYPVSQAGGKGIRINISFLQRSITDVRIPNNAFTQAEAGKPGEYVYETDGTGHEKYDGDAPIVKKYYAYADYVMSYDDNVLDAAEGKMPVYYIDPYNTATFTLPQKAFFEFEETGAGVYAEYKIAGWQYFDENRNLFLQIPSERTAGARFFTDAEAGRSYFNPAADSYKGKAYVMRGYISVGSDSQYFDVLFIVLNRTLRTTATIKSEYSVSYDFDDPIAAMLSDIPAMLGEDAFVDYDKYNEAFSARTVRTVRETATGATYAFSVTGENAFSQKDTNGTPTNIALVPELLWDEAYDVDGDGQIDYTFEDLTTTGFDGVIGGNLFAGASNLFALISYYDKTENSVFDRLVRALMWDDLFDENGEISSSFSASARATIATENAAYKREVAYAAYKAMTSVMGTDEELANDIAAGKALSSEDKGALTSTLFNTVLQRLNVERQNAGLQAYDRDNENDRVFIVYAIFEAVSEAYEAWRQMGGAKTSEADIYTVWQYFIDKYRSSDVTASGAISANQIYKAAHYYNVIGAEGVLGGEERNKLSTQFNIKKKALYTVMNAQVWRDVYGAASDKEKVVMDAYLQQWGTSMATDTGYSAAMDVLRTEIEKQTAIGATGEPASADISIPVIRFSDLKVNSSETPKVIRFNKFNFDSIDVSFTVEFELDYEAIYKRMTEQAREDAIASYRDEKKGATLTEYEARLLRAAVDGVNPEEVLKYNAEIFDYAMWIRDNRRSSYSAFWTTLYDYRVNDAVRTITENIGELYRDHTFSERYAAMGNSFTISADEWLNVLYNFRFIKVPAMAKTIVQEAETQYGIDTPTGRWSVLRALAAYAVERDTAIGTLAEAFERLGVNRNLVDEQEAVTDEILQTAERNFVKTKQPTLGQDIDLTQSEVGVFQAIVEKRIAAIAEECDIVEHMNLEANRRNAARALADYILGEDSFVKTMDEVYKEQEDEQRIVLAKNVMSSTYSNASAISAAKSLSRDNGGSYGDTTYGFGVIFAIGYSEYAEALYTLLGSDLNASEAKAQLSLIEANLSAIDSDLKNGIIGYESINGETALSTVANLYFDILTVYNGRTASPYDKLLTSGRAYALTGYTEEQIQGMAQYAIYDAAPYNVLAENATILRMTAEQIASALRQRSLMSYLYNNVSTANRAEWTEITDSAYAPIRLKSMNDVFRSIAPTIANTLKTAYDTSSATANLNYYSFIALVEKAIKEAEQERKIYESKKDEYVEKNAYRYSKELLDALYADYGDSKRIGSSGSLDDAGGVATTFFGSYFEGQTYLTITDPSDDYYDETYSEEVLTDVLAQTGMTGIGADAKNRVMNVYVKDLLLRAIVYYYENVADEDKRDVVEEVLETYTQTPVTSSLLSSVVSAAVSNILNENVGLSVYKDLKERGDVGTAEAAVIDCCYYTVWYQNMSAAVKRSIETYDEGAIVLVNPYLNLISNARRFMARITGLTESTLGEELSALAHEYALALSRKAIGEAAARYIREELDFEDHVRAALEDEAEIYAYDLMYEEKNGRGVYVYKDVFDGILEDIVLSEATELNKLVFETAQKTELESKLAVLKEAVSSAVKTELYAELYDSVKLFTFTPEEFAQKAYIFITGREAEDPVKALLGVTIGAGGIVGDIVSEYRRGEVTDEINAERLDRLQEWWLTDGKEENETMYGLLTETEQEFLEQAYTQARYQVTTLLGRGVNVTLADRKRLAAATMLASLYLLLKDVRDAEKTVPADYFSVGNEDERKAFIVGLMLDGELLKDDGHSFSLSQAQLKARMTTLAKDRAMMICRAATASYYVDKSTTEEFIEAAMLALIRVATPSGLSEEETAIYTRYMKKAVSYVEYTSVLGAKEYEHYDDPVAGYPLSRYAEQVYKKVTGYDISGAINYAQEEAPTMLGRMSFGYFLYAVKDSGVADEYAAAMEEMLQERIVSENDYVSEDYVKVMYEKAMAAIGEKLKAGLTVSKAEYEAAEKILRHVVYFDRKEWDEYMRSGSQDMGIVTAYYADKNVYVANSEKTNRIMGVEGYEYANSIRAQGMEYMLSDFTTVDLYFETTEDDPYDDNLANVLNIDALSPELPSTAYAKGYINIGGEERTIELGKVNVDSYSSEFYKLVYHKSEPVADDAYQVQLRAASGFVFNKLSGIKVGYKDRNVSKVYLESDEYSAGRAIQVNDSASEFNGLYNIYDSAADSPRSGKNVIHIDPTDESKLLVAGKTYIMPTVLYIECEEGSGIKFTDVEWDLSEVTYGLAGTGDAGKEIRVKKYSYTDDDGNGRTITYDYRTLTVKMEVFDSNTGNKTSERTYTLGEGDMIEWNTVLFVDNQSIDYITNDDTGERFGSKVENSMLIDTTGYIEINPYYPEFPTNMSLALSTGDVKTVTLKQSDWIPNSSKLRMIQRGEAQDLEFKATFPYLGYTVQVSLYAMDIRVPSVDLNAQLFNGGRIYLVRGEGDVETQFKRNYSEMYFNFNDDPDGEPNWQKVPVSLERYDSVRIGESDVQAVRGIIGASGIGNIDANAMFYVQVVSPQTYAMLNGEYNTYVTFDYYSIPTSRGSQATGMTSSPDTMSGIYLYDYEGEREVFRAQTDELEPDFINDKVRVTLEYDYDENTSDRLAYDKEGNRVRRFSFATTLKHYEITEVSTPTFNKDDDGKKWTWTPIPETNAAYKDAIYWPIGTEMKASDLPTVYDKNMGKDFELMWDLADLNVNRANVRVPGEVTADDGVAITGYYMQRNGTWASLTLTVYIEKINITQNVIEFRDGDVVNESPYIIKTYDSQYYVLPFDPMADNLKILRENGVKESLGADAFVIRYAAAQYDDAGREVTDFNSLVWSETAYPLSAGRYFTTEEGGTFHGGGKYYIRVEFAQEDYNAYIELQDDQWLFALTIQPYMIDMSQLKFVGEDERSTIKRTYGEGVGDLVVESGLKAFVPAGWFSATERETKYNNYFELYSSETKAKAAVYREQIALVTSEMREKFTEWYGEGVAAVGSDEDAVMAWVYDNKLSVADPSVVEAKVIVSYYKGDELLKYPPTNVGNYGVVVEYDKSNGNYAEMVGREKTLILSIEKDESLVYSVTNTTLTYNGNAQNPQITGLHNGGTLPVGVIVTYTYTWSEGILVIKAEGAKDENGNAQNIVSIDPSSTIPDALSGIKNVGNYDCSISILGGDNFINGEINDIRISIAPASIYILLDDIVAKYLDDVKDLNEYIRIYDRNGVLQENGRLLGTDRISDLGRVSTSTEVASHFKVGNYVSRILGMKVSATAATEYTTVSSGQYGFMGDNYRLLLLKTYEQEGSLYRNADASENLIRLFNNYQIFIRQENSYKIEQEPGSDGVSTDEELQAYIAALRDNDTKVVYLQPLIDENGDITAYSPIVINKAVNLTIVGYRSNESDIENAEIETLIRGIKVLRGTVTLRIVAVVGEEDGKAAVSVEDGAGRIYIYDSLITAKEDASNVIGLQTGINYAQGLYIDKTIFKGLSVGLQLNGGELEIEESEIGWNYNGLEIRMNSTYVSIKTTKFDNNQGKALTSVMYNITARENVFEYNYIALDVPEESTIKTNVNNNNVFSNNGDD